MGGLRGIGAPFAQGHYKHCPRKIQGRISGSIGQKLPAVAGLRATQIAALLYVWKTYARTG